MDHPEKRRARPRDGEVMPGTLGKDRGCGRPREKELANRWAAAQESPEVKKGSWTEDAKQGEDCDRGKGGPHISGLHSPRLGIGRPEQMD